MKVVAIIPAKGNSKRFPEKNLFNIRGKPMLYWSYLACCQSKYDISAYVSTSCENIKTCCYELGINVIDRPQELSESKVYKQEVIRYAALRLKECLNPDIWISLQPNSPQITHEHLDAGIDLLLKYSRDEIFSVGSNLMQNAAFRIFKGDYVFQKDLSTNCGVIVCDLVDVNVREDVDKLE